MNLVSLQSAMVIQSPWQKHSGCLFLLQELQHDLQAPLDHEDVFSVCIPAANFDRLMFCTDLKSIRLTYDFHWNSRATSVATHISNHRWTNRSWALINCLLTWVIPFAITTARLEGQVLIAWENEVSGFSIPGLVHPCTRYSLSWGHSCPIMSCDWLPSW